MGWETTINWASTTVPTQNSVSYLFVVVIKTLKYGVYIYTLY